MPSFMKEAIKKTFMELLTEIPLSEITVKMIVERCGINRNSFYYHFQGIPSLIEEMVKEEADILISRYDTIDSLETALHAAASFVEEQRAAVLHIYNSISRDVFEKYLWMICDYVVNKYLQGLIQDVDISEVDREIIARFFRCECFGLMIYWLDRRMETNMEEHISRFCQMYRNMPEEMIERAMEK